MSRLIVALCVVGCLYAVQAKPHIGKLGGEIESETKGFDAVPTDQLLNGAYDKLSTLLDTFTADEVAALREPLKKFVIFFETRLLENDPKLKKLIRKLPVEMDGLTKERLVEVAHMVYVQVFDFDYLSETEIEKTRAILIEFLNDSTPDIKYYIDHSWDTLYDNATIEKLIERVQTNKITFSELFTEIVHKLNNLRDSVWATRKIELTNMIVKTIKRVDEDLVKCGDIEGVEATIEHQSYESLSTLPYNMLVRELSYRFEDLYHHIHLDETGTVVTNLIKFLKNIDEQIVKYNRIK